MTRRALLALALVAVVALGSIAPAATAGDAVAIFEFEDDEYEAAAGETVEVEIWLSSDGGYSGEGIGNYQFVVAVPPEVGEIVAVEPGPWLAGDGGEVEQEIERLEDGAVRVEHERVGADDGRTGYDVAATVTVEVAEDAPAADAVLDVVEADAYLVESEFPLQTFGRETTIAVEGGGDALEHSRSRDDEDDEDGADVTTAEEADREVEVDENGSEDDTSETADEDDPAPSDGETDAADGGSGADELPGFGLAAAVATLLSAAALVGRRRG